MEATTTGTTKLDTAKRLILEYALEEVTKGSHDDVNGSDKERCVLNALAASVSDVELALHQYAAERARAYNSRLRIHRIPHETLVSIIFHALQSFMLSNYFHRLETIATVCTTWRDLIEGEPSLWGVLCSTNPHRASAKALSMSKEASLDVQYNDREHTIWYSSPQPVVPEFVSTSFLEHVTRQMHRWRSAELSVRSGDVLKSMSTRSAPRLTDLSLIASTSSFTTDAFSQEAPNLRHLCLDKVLVTWSWRLLSRLRTLHLTGLADGFPTLAQLFSLLQSSPDIVSLKLTNTFFSRTADLAPATLLPIHLRKLEELHLGLQPDIIRSILQNIRIPSCVMFSLSCNGVSAPSSDVSIFDSTDHILPIVRSLLTRTDKLEILVDHSWLLATTWGPTASFHLNLNGYDPANSLRWLTSDILAASTTPSVRLDIRKRVPIDLALKTIRSGCPITTLRLRRRPTDDISALLAALSQPLDGTTSWPLPNLRDLAFGRSEVSPTDLLQMMRLRYGGVVDGRATGLHGAELPAPLASLMFEVGEMFSLEQMGEIEGITGPGVVNNPPSPSDFWADNIPSPVTVPGSPPPLGWHYVPEVPVGGWNWNQ